MADALFPSRSVIRKLHSIAACPPCTLLLTGVDVTTVDANDPASILTFLRADFPDYEVPGPEAVCPACLGASTLPDDVLREAGESVRTSGFTSTDFSLSIRLPISLQARQRAIMLWLHSENSEYALQEISTKYLLRARLARAIGEVCQMAAKSDVEADLSVTLAVEHPESADEYQFLSAITPAPPGRSYKGRGDTLSRRCDNTHNVLAFLNKASPQDLRSHNFFPPPAPTTRATLSSVTVARKSRFIAGRYTKYSRNVSNSPFIINNVKVAPTSVAEQIGLPLQEAYQATDYKFVGSGREDVDVRMLGTGRPFYIELVNPRRAHLTPEELDNVRQTAINSFAPVQAVGILREIKAHLTAGIKEGEENKTKEYACLVWLKDPIAADEAAVKVRPYQEGFTVQQKCPVRVMNRRALLTRPKQIHTLDVKILEPHFALVTLSTEAGTYIKEFVHSDCGRSSPSLAEILDTSADLLELDVVNVDLAWPPAAES